MLGAEIVRFLTFKYGLLKDKRSRGGCPNADRTSGRAAPRTLW